MIVEVKQQHVSYKTNHKPHRRFHDSFEFRSHEESIPLRGDSRAVGRRLDAEMIQLRL
jgi:hypothetical protein